MSQTTTNSGKVVVHRTSQRDIKMRDLVIQLDEEPERIVAFGQSSEWEVKPGHHTLSATNRLFTKREELEIAAGEVVTFVAANVGGGCFSALMIIGSTGAYRVTLERS